MVRRHAHRPDDAVIVMVLFNNRCKRPVDTDAVTAHQRILLLTVFIKIGHIHADSILCPKFKNMPQLIALFGIEGRAALRTNIARFDDSDIVHHRRGKIPFRFNMDIVHILFERAGNGIMHQHNAFVCQHGRFG